MAEVSVIVCTRNRTGALRRALASLEAQTLSRERFEVIVVDNGGGAEEIAREAGADVVVRELEPGLSRARNVGWRHARAALVAFLDDDAVAAPEWLAQALDICAGLGHPVAIGGPILPFWEVPPPSWFREDWELREWGDSERLLADGESLSGSNVFFSRDALERLGGFNEQLGMIGDRLLVGEESDLFSRLWQSESNPSMVYSPALLVRHSVDPKKLSVRYQLRRASAYGESHIIGQALNAGGRIRTLPWSARMLLGSVLHALRHLRRPLRQWAVEELRVAAIRWGMIKAALRGR
jgi:glucosyl-dolichyl phosphate glucuronosyltransferase